MMPKLTRRNFLKNSAMITGVAMTNFNAVTASSKKSKVAVSAHPWVYASKFPPDFDCYPVLSEAFADIKKAGFAGIELMRVILMHDDAVTTISALVDQHKLPVTGCSFSGDMWNADKHNAIYENADLITERLAKLGGETFGISVGNAKRKKTTQELDAQAILLKKIITLCESRKLKPNLHNHTYEVENDLHDLKGTLERLPDVKLGPDLNWLIRGGVDPVWFINTYGRQIVYMHLRDQKANGKWAEAMGEGVTDFKSIAKALQKQNFSGRVAVELAFDEPTTRPLPETWQMSRDYVRKTFGW